MIRLERRSETRRGLAIAVPIVSVLSALIAGSLLILLSGNNPLKTYARIVERAFTSGGSLSGTLIAATPLLFTGMAAAAAFRMGVFNIGGQGQYFMGAIAASGVGLAWGQAFGRFVIPLMIVMGAIAGALWAAIVGVLRAWFNTNEIITSLMLNYVASNITAYLIFNSRSAWRLLTGSGLMFPQGKPLPEKTNWPLLGIGSLNVPFGFVVGSIVALLVWTLYQRTRFGFEVRIIADAPAAANYAGMRTKRKVVSVMALSGSLAGIGGASDVGDLRHVLDPKGLDQSGYGYSGIVIAALARLNTVAVVVVAVLMGGLANAGRSLQGKDFPAGLVGTLQGLVLFFALGGEILSRYRVRRMPRATHATGAPRFTNAVSDPVVGAVGDAVGTAVSDASTGGGSPS
jgi:general nucleoside transport system permease protein